jgi:hypothetical protein
MGICAFETFHRKIVHNHQEQFTSAFPAQPQRAISARAPQWHAMQPRAGVELRWMAWRKWKNW